LASAIGRHHDRVANTWRSPAPVDYLYADIWDKLGAPEAAADTRAMCRNLRPKSAGYWGMEANFVSFLAHNRCRPPVTRSQFQAWARTLRVPRLARAHPRRRDAADIRRLAGVTARASG